MTKAAMIRAHQASLELVLTSHDQLTIVSDIADAAQNMDLLRAAMEERRVLRSTADRRIMVAARLGEPGALAAGCSAATQRP